MPRFQTCYLFSNYKLEHIILFSNKNIASMSFIIYDATVLSRTKLQSLFAIISAIW